MENKPNFETGKGLTVRNDTRNVIDKYKGLSVEEIKKDLETSRHNFHIAVENFQHDFNIGTIARNANAFNAAGIHIIGKRHWNRRGAMKTEAYMNVLHHKNVQDFVNWAKENNLRLIAIEQFGSTRSVNVGVASGILMYEFVRRNYIEK